MFVFVFVYGVSLGVITQRMEKKISVSMYSVELGGMSSRLRVGLSCRDSADTQKNSGNRLQISCHRLELAYR